MLECFDVICKSSVTSTVQVYFWAALLDECYSKSVAGQSLCLLHVHVHVGYVEMEVSSYRYIVTVSVISGSLPPPWPVLAKEELPRRDREMKSKFSYGFMIAMKCMYMYMYLQFD